MSDYKPHLLAALRDCEKLAEKDPEAAHGAADVALLAYINDDEIMEAFERVRKWYA